MSYKTGKSKSLDDITLNDVLEYPIWEWSLDEEGEEGQDETWQRPIINEDNVTDRIFDPIITIKVKDTDIYGSGQYDHKRQSLTAVTIWEDNDWKMLSDFQYPTPLIFTSIPKINGAENVQFICRDLSVDELTIL